MIPNFCLTLQWVEVLVEDARRNPAEAIMYRQRLDNLMSQWALPLDKTYVYVPRHAFWSQEAGTAVHAPFVSGDDCVLPEHEGCGILTYKLSTLLARFIKKQKPVDPDLIAVQDDRERADIWLRRSGAAQAQALEYVRRQLKCVYSTQLKVFWLDGDGSDAAFNEAVILNKTLQYLEEEGIDSTPVDVDTIAGRLLGEARRKLSGPEMEDNITDAYEVEKADRWTFKMEEARTCDMREYTDGLPHESLGDGPGRDYLKAVCGHMWWRFQKVIDGDLVDDIDRVQCFTREMKLPQNETGWFMFRGVLAREQDILDIPAMGKALQYGMQVYTGIDVRPNQARLNREVYSPKEVNWVETEAIANVYYGGELYQVVKPCEVALPIKRAYRTLVSGAIADYLGLQHTVYAILHGLRQAHFQKDWTTTEILKQVNSSVISVTGLVAHTVDHGDGFSETIKTRLLIQKPCRYYKSEIIVEESNSAELWLLMYGPDLKAYFHGEFTDVDATKTRWVGVRIGRISKGVVRGHTFRKLVKSRRPKDKPYGIKRVRSTKRAPSQVEVVNHALFQAELQAIAAEAWVGRPKWDGEVWVKPPEGWYLDLVTHG